MNSVPKGFLIRVHPPVASPKEYWAKEWVYDVIDDMLKVIEMDGMKRYIHGLPFEVYEASKYGEK